MPDHISKINEMLLKRFCCSQIIVSLALDIKGSEIPETERELLRAMSGLCRGIGSSGKNCGALTGGACAIGIICGSGAADETPHEHFDEMIKELIGWFEDEYGSVDCGALTGGDPQKRKAICPGIIRATYENMTRVLLDNGVDIGNSAMVRIYKE